MHEGCWHVVLQLNYGESQRRDGQNLGAIDRPVPLKFSCWCHAELMGKMPPLVMVLSKKKKRFLQQISADHCDGRFAFKKNKIQLIRKQIELASLCWCLLRATVFVVYWLT